MRQLAVILAVAGLAAAATAQNAPTKAVSAPRPMEQGPAADQPDSTGLYNAALLELGATARGTGAYFNKDWPPDNTLVRDKYNGGTIFDKAGSLKGGRVDIRLLIPVDIKAVEVVGLDYHGTRQPKAMDIFVEGKRIEHADLGGRSGASPAHRAGSPRAERRDPRHRRISAPAAGLRRLAAVAGADDDQCGGEDEDAGAV